LLVTVGWWPHEIDFDHDDLATVVKIINDRNKRR
jgi:hypothetical protein